ncbi:Gti1/Pac2 family-domain-containing protein [Durotheca rogersii]|uniref:Gti1/Pac2 family-domain-containing protein n=1 Tax=Durotheca rogersii TaxID=419775 RepID=UPI00221F1C7D|nr:Gti1/Pac2 family-domain-containing protein [Durotheca rogersii]KAI5863797.1 Gti1/Pac2 family-domain-containing protein [Durotheca rogersii]
METYHGYVRTPADAIKLFEACRLGLLPRVQRRLSEKERQSIRSGSVFVWDEREAGMRRWTDGKSWSASRVSGSFLTYREMEGKRGTGFGGARRSNGRTPDSGRLSDEDPDGEPEGYRYKADGLMKQSFSITTSQGQHLHLISYYSRPHAGAPDLPQPSTDPQLRHIVPLKGMYPESSLHDTTPPAMTRTPMQPYASHTTPIDQPGYGYSWGGPWQNQGQWPPSPNHTPPWGQGKLTPEMKPQPRPQVHHPVQRPPQLPHQLPQLPPQLPPPLAAAPPNQPIYPKALGNGYENERLPPPTLTMPYSLPPRAPSLSPQSRQLQIQAAKAAQVAQAAQPMPPAIDPRLTATSARNPQGPLPAMPTAPRGGLTPPRMHSVSPPRTMGPDAVIGSANKASLSALLNRTPASSEPNSANPGSNSAGSSPRALSNSVAGPAGGTDMFRGEDTRALRSLDRKFCS